MKTSYIGPERQLRGDIPLTKEQAVTLVVDELLKAYTTFKHTKLKLDLLIVIERALYLQQLGFELILDRRHDCIGAHRKETKYGPN